MKSHTNAGHQLLIDWHQFSLIMVSLMNYARFLTSLNVILPSKLCFFFALLSLCSSFLPVGYYNLTLPHYNHYTNMYKIFWPIGGCISGVPLNKYSTLKILQYAGYFWCSLTIYTQHQQAYSPHCSAYCTSWDSMHML